MKEKKTKKCEKRKMIVKNVKAKHSRDILSVIVVGKSMGATWARLQRRQSLPRLHDTSTWRIIIFFQRLYGFWRTSFRPNDLFKTYYIMFSFLHAYAEQNFKKISWYFIFSSQFTYLSFEQQIRLSAWNMFILYLNSFYRVILFKYLTFI